jgi:hypothetical protein
MLRSCDRRDLEHPARDVDGNDSLLRIQVEISPDPDAEVKYANTGQVRPEFAACVSFDPAP